jgi:4-oxalocrotonate tautomerase
VFTTAIVPAADARARTDSNMNSRACTTAAFTPSLLFNIYAKYISSCAETYGMPVIQVTISQGRTVEQKRELVQVLTKETARILKTKEESIRILIYEVSKENWGNAGVLGLDMR